MAARPGPGPTTTAAAPTHPECAVGLDAALLPGGDQRCTAAIEQMVDQRRHGAAARTGHIPAPRRRRKAQRFDQDRPVASLVKGCRGRTKHHVADHWLRACADCNPCRLRGQPQGILVMSGDAPVAFARPCKPRPAQRPRTGCALEAEHGQIGPDRQNGPVRQAYSPWRLPRPFSIIIRFNIVRKHTVYCHAGIGILRLRPECRAARRWAAHEGPVPGRGKAAGRGAAGPGPADHQSCASRSGCHPPAGGRQSSIRCASRMNRLVLAPRPDRLRAFSTGACRMPISLDRSLARWCWADGVDDGSAD
jgi:hypothetical protein